MPNSSARACGLGWALALCLLPLLGFWATGLFDLDEGFYAAVVGEMNRRGDWITPWYNGRPWFEKPILLYWLAKPAVSVFGEVWGPRLPSVACSLALAALLWRTGSSRFGVRAGFWAAAVFGTSLLAVGLSRMMMTDVPMALAFSACLVLFWESLQGRPWLRPWAAVCLGLAVLAKGPVAGALFLLIAGWTWWRQPELRPGFRGGWGWSVAAFAAVVALWYLPAWLVHREEFVRKFLVEQNLARFGGGDEAHKVPFWPGLVYFLPVLLVGMFPWSLWIPASWPRGGSADPFLRYCAAWAAVVFAFFTLSGSKLPHYVLPAVPPLALLVGARAGRQDWPAAAAWAASVAAFGLANWAFWAWYTGRIGGVEPHAEVHELARWVRERAGRVVSFQMGKQPGGSSRGLQQTEHPSVVFYVRRDVVQTSDWTRLAELRDAWVITRAGRIDPARAASLLKEGLALEPVRRLTGYELWQLHPARGGGAPRAGDRTEPPSGR
ncbi:MAG: glycosyltransferase family 39 protein [Fimbriimonadales bacterium]|nr:glycosyltransferase family 39 protein [Fimbriimonadales bacterium]